jgi:hypothetical protein
MCSGKVHVVHEIWHIFKKSFNTPLQNGCIENLVTHEAISEEGWWVPNFVIEMCPGLPSYQALNRCSKMFSRKGSGTKGVFIDGPQEWHGDQYKKTIKDLGLNFKIQYAKSADELWKELYDAKENNQAIVIFNWSPNFTDAVFDGQMIEFPDKYRFKHNLKMFVWKGFQKKWPDAYKVLKKINFSTMEFSKMAAFVDVNGMSHEKAAQQWIKENTTKVAYILDKSNEIKIVKKNTSKIEKVKPKITTTEQTVQTVIVKNDTIGPEIIVNKTFVANQNLTVNINGRVEDDSKIVSLTIDGDQVAFTNGAFNQTFYVLPNGQKVEIIAIDKFANQSKKIVILKRAAVQTQTVSIDKLNPLAIKSPLNSNAVALIIGVEDYENTFKAAYAKQDALFFNDFVHQAFGVPRQNVKLLINDRARRNDTLLEIATWLPKVIRENKTDLYLFFSGHGLASANGEDLFLLPYDGYPAILEDSALLRNRIFESIAKLNPRTVTVFLDTCYSGATRSEEMLVAARPIMIEVQEQVIPNNFTVFSASANNEIASVFKEAEHGLFSYFLMKGLEGEADKNNDQQITNGELHAFINNNVSRLESQTPQLSGDPNQVLVQW